MAEKWGIGDDIIREEFQEKMSMADKRELQAKLNGRHAEITAWLDSFPDQNMSVEAGCFMYMQLAVDEMGLWSD